MTTFTSVTPNLLVRDVAKSLEFYRDVLGFTVGETVPASAPFVFVMLASDGVPVFLNNAATAAHEYPPAASMPPGGTATMFFISAGVARSVNLYQSRSGRSYAVQTIGWSRELTGDLAPGMLRGCFAWGVEATPVFAQFQPSDIYGVGFAPLVWRWNFTPHLRWSM